MSPADKFRARENPEPTESVGGVPWYVLAAIGIAACWGVFYLATTPQKRDMPVASAAPAVIDGKQIFASNCAACHQASGAGLPGAFPPLAGSEWLEMKPDVVVQVVLHGLSGKVEVKGSSFDGVMPGFGKQLNDEQVAAVATYVRTSWGNKGSEVDTAFVKAQREKTAARADAWSGQKDLQALADGAH